MPIEEGAFAADEGIPVEGTNEVALPLKLTVVEADTPTALGTNCCWVAGYDAL